MTGLANHLMTDFMLDISTDLDKLESIIENTSGHSSVHGDLWEYDILQQAIIIGHSSAVNYILMKEVIPTTYKPVCNGYLHLACKLGRTNIVKTLMECRPADFHAKSHGCYPAKCLLAKCNKSGKSSSLILGHLPIDIVSANQQRDCLLGLLHSLPADMMKKLMPAAFLCDMDHNQALGLYLKGPIDSKDLKEAYHHALLKKRDRCLEVLFQYGYKDFNIRGMNPFHFLYQYSEGYNRHSQRHEKLCATTACLLKHGADAAAYRPAGSYPLYSLLDMIMKDVCAYGEEYWSESISRELISCLKLILRQGVRLDLDELYIQHSRKDEDEPVAYGRESFRSVFGVISSNAANALCINLAASEVLRDCVNILINQPKPATPKPSHLSGILILLARSLRSRSTTKNLEEVVIKLLWEGINPSRPIQHEKGVWSVSFTTEYLVNQYIEALCKADVPDSCMKATLNENSVVKWLTNLMSYNSRCAAIQINIRTLASLKYQNLTDSFLKYITSHPLLRLKTLSAKVTWSAVRMDKSKLKCLPIPRHLQNSLLDIIIKEI